MKVWRMAFKWGSQGESQWENCKEKKVAAIGYYDSDYEPIVGDCRQISEDEYGRIWRESGINAKASQGSLKKFAYRMESGDIIYAKDGPWIVGKGKVSEYHYKSDGILDEVPWEHYREVEWEDNFNKFKLVLGADLHTVLELNGDRLNNILEADKKYNGK